ncbi:MAG: type II secretion system F family protein [Rhizobiaceae bacterium]
MTENTILILTFLSVLIVSVVVVRLISARAAVARRIRETGEDDKEEPELIPDDVRGLPISEAELVRNYFRVIRSDKDPNSVNNRLIRAGFFSGRAPMIFHTLRIVVTAAAFIGVMIGIERLLPQLPLYQRIIAGTIVGAVAFFVCAIIVEFRGDKREVEYRKIFPDFMDSLIVCVDSGLSVEAAVDRVSKEYLKSRNKDFGLHLIIMMLEVRGGRRLRDALSNFAKRLRIDEAQSLAVLFRQSEELGASVTQALRVFSQEMRDKRMVRAEEKANALPFKMLFPLALFLFPISVLIVAVPILIRVIELLRELAPGAG